MRGEDVGEGGGRLERRVATLGSRDDSSHICQEIKVSPLTLELGASAVELTSGAPADEIDVVHTD